MKPFKYDFAGIEKQTVWPFNTMESFSRRSDGNLVIPPPGNTLSDALQTMQCLSATSTQQGITHSLRQNQRRISASVKSGIYKGIKDLFTAPCPICETAGIPIPGKEGSGIPFLHCEGCDKTFPVKSIHWGKMAISVGAGPSLDNNIKELKRIQGQAVIMACDAALKPLIETGIRPNYILCLEWDPLSQRLFEGVGDVNDITLLLTTGACPEVRRSWGGPVYVFDSPTIKKRDTMKQRAMFGDIGVVTPGGNVTAAMLGILSAIQVDPIVFVGHDFSYPAHNRYYAAGIHRGCVPLKQRFTTHNIYGDTVYLDQTLFSYKMWHEMVIDMLSKNIGIRFINATEGGILGATYYDPKKLVKIKHAIRILKYKFSMLRTEHRWPSTEEAQKNGFKGPNLGCMEYMKLSEIIDEYIANSVSSETSTRVEAAA